MDAILTDKNSISSWNYCWLLCNLLATKHSSLMMFTIMTHDNQSTLLSFSLSLGFVTNGTFAEKALSGSSDMGLIVIKTWRSLRLFDLFFVGSKDSFPFSQFVIGSLSVPEDFCRLHSHGFCALISNVWLNFQCLKLLLYNGSQIALWCLSLIV